MTWDRYEWDGSSETDMSDTFSMYGEVMAHMSPGQDAATFACESGTCLREKHKIQELCHMSEWVMAQVRVMAHVWVSHATGTQESRPTRKRGCYWCDVWRDLSSHHVWHDESRDVWRDSLIRVAWLIYVCDTPRACVWHDPSTRAPWPSRCMWHDSYIRDSYIRPTQLLHGFDYHIHLPWLICMCAMTHARDIENLFWRRRRALHFGALDSPDRALAYGVAIMSRLLEIIGRFAECILFYRSHPISTIGVVLQTHMSRISHVTHAIESCHAYDGVTTTHTHQIFCVTHILLPRLLWQKQPTKLAFVTDTKKSTSSGTNRHAGSLFPK